MVELKEQVVRAVLEKRYSDLDKLLGQIASTPMYRDDYELLNIRAANEFRKDNQEKAIEIYRLSIEKNKYQVLAYKDLGLIFEALNRWHDGLDIIEKGLKFSPQDTHLLEVKAVLLHGAKRYDESEVVYKKLLSIHPEASAYWTSLGNIYLEITEIDKALECHRKAVNYNPNSDTAVFNFITTMHYHPRFKNEDIHPILTEYSKLFPYSKIPEFKLNVGTESARIKVGFLSNGFRNNPVGQMILPALSELDKNQFDLFFYSTSLQEDYITENLRSIAKEYSVVANLDDDQLYTKLQKDDLDVLFELSGFHAGSRMSLISRKPVPVIIKWVGGLINSTKIRTVDYLLSDRVETPPGVDDEYSEKLIRMPTDYICYRLPPYIPEVAGLPALKNGYVTYGCLNNASKINDQHIERWIKILNKVPDSRILLKSFQFESQYLCTNIKEKFYAKGIDPKRLILEGSSPHQAHLNTYNRIDIALDTWPYSGGLTTVESLAMGVPVITLPGPTFAGRHSASHLAHAGMPELIAESASHYVDLAVSLSSDLESLATIRSHLRRILENSAVCDATSFSKYLAEALKLVVDKNRSGIPPTAISWDLESGIRA